MLCYVCGKEIEPREVQLKNYDPKHLGTWVANYKGKWVRRSDLPVYVGNDTYRHESCAPGTAKWITIRKSKGRRRSKMLTYFTRKDHDNDIQTR